MSRDVWKCPAETCDDTFASKAAVKGHWGGKQDEDHRGPWHEADEAYREATESAEAGTEEAVVDGGGSEGGKLELPEQGSSGTSAEPTTDAVCPDCGGEKYDTVGNAADKIEQAGYDPSAAPDDARVCYDCWVEGELVVYEP